MKLNQELVVKLTLGQIELEHTGTVDELKQILKASFPNAARPTGVSKYYFKNEHEDYLLWNCSNNKTGLPTYTTEQFFEEKGVDDYIVFSNKNLRKSSQDKSLKEIQLTDISCDRSITDSISLIVFVDDRTGGVKTLKNRNAPIKEKQTEQKSRLTEMQKIVRLASTTPEEYCKTIQSYLEVRCLLAQQILYHETPNEEWRKAPIDTRMSLLELYDEKIKELLNMM